MKSQKRKAKKADPAHGKSVQEAVLDSSLSFSYDLVPTLQQKPKKANVGRPTIPDNFFWGRLNDVAYLFEVNWPYFGWRIHCLRNREASSSDEVREAFEPLRGKHGHERIAYLLRLTSVPATSDEVRGTLEALGEARTKLRAVEEAYTKHIERFNEARAAVYQASQQHGQQLKTQISFRIGNRGRLKKESADIEKALTVARNRIDEIDSKHRKAAESELLQRQIDLQKCTETLQGEESIIAGLKNHLTVATKKNWLLARQEKRRRLQALRRVTIERKKQQAATNQLQNLYFDQAAGFSRKDISRFLAEKRALHHPWQLAKAVAGLPEMGCRQSFLKAGKLPFERSLGLDFQIFQLIDKTWSKRNPEKPEALSRLVAEQMNRMPKMISHGGTRVSNFLLSHLEENREHLEEAIQWSCRVKPLPHPDEIPYVVTARFLENLSKPRTTLERVLSGLTSA